MNEVVIFQDALVTITTARAVLNGTTYAMANVTSVRHIKEPGQGIQLGCLATAVFGLGAIFVINNWSVGWWLLGLGAALLGAAYGLRRPKHWVRIGTSGAESNAVFSHDFDWTNRIVAAINTAIVSRG